MKKNLLIIPLLLLPFWCGAQEHIDSDKDGLSDNDEKNIYFTDSENTDTDADGYEDGVEILYGYSPRHGNGKKLIQVDSDNDYLNDKWELILGTGLMNPDSDSDSYLDGTEVAASYNPLSSNSVRLEKIIKVDLEKQQLEYFFEDYKFDSFLISSGIASMPTPTGDFEILDKVPVKHYGGSGYNFSYPNTNWNLHFTTQKYRYYIHGAYWHNNFGHPMSHGCVNVSYENMEQLYWWAEVGAKVKIY